MRCLLNAGISIDKIPFNTPEELKGFKVIIGKTPKQVYDHVITHDMLTKLAESSGFKNVKTFKIFKFITTICFKPI
jgi:hypothetical protein